MPIEVPSTDIALVTQADVETALVRPLSSTEQQYITQQCIQASDKLRGAMPSVDDRIAQWSVDPRPATALSFGTVAAVLGEVIARVLRNPTGATSVSRTDGPFSRTLGFGGEQPGSPGGWRTGIRITASDLDQLTPTNQYSPPRTIRTPLRLDRQ